LAALYLRQDKTPEATALLEKLHAANPSDPGITRLYARLLSQVGQYDRSEPLLASLVTASPGDLSVVDDHADALIHLKRFAEAEHLLAGPVFARSKQSTTGEPGELASAASHLAFAASQNNDPEVTLHALEIRRTLQAQSASSLFLEATAHDKLHHVKQAQSSYRQFLTVANGQFPDEEWEARHRLITLEHMK
jgi:tetratricopeptide (TPR) repeat protein